MASTAYVRPKAEEGPKCETTPCGSHASSLKHELESAASDLWEFNLAPRKASDILRSYVFRLEATNAHPKTNNARAESKSQPSTQNPIINHSIPPNGNGRSDFGHQKQ